MYNVMNGLFKFFKSQYADDAIYRFTHMLRVNKALVSIKRNKNSFVFLLSYPKCTCVCVCVCGREGDGSICICVYTFTHTRAQIFLLNWLGLVMCLTEFSLSSNFHRILNSIFICIDFVLWHLSFVPSVVRSLCFPVCFRQAEECVKPQTCG